MLQGLCLQLAYVHDIFPQSLLLRDVEVANDATRIAGAFADVLRGRWKMTEVAVKKVHTLPVASGNKLRRSQVSPTSLVYLPQK